MMKNTNYFLLTLFCCLSFLVFSESAVQSSVGDVNSDSSIDLKDVIQALQISAGLFPLPNQPIDITADVNGDGKIGIEEAIYALQKCICPEIQIGWNGSLIIPNSNFFNTLKWTLNKANEDQSIDVSSNNSDLQLSWSLNNNSWVQCYMNLTTPISLSQFDIFGIDLKGIAITGSIGFELKFEDDGNQQAIMRWDQMEGMNRWYEKLVALKKQFANWDVINWSNIKIISLAVYSSNQSSSGTLNVKNLVASLTKNWTKAYRKEDISPENYKQIKTNAINAIINRQTTTGLLTTWAEDGSSWLYGQGLALKSLVLEGVWEGTKPVNNAAKAAEKLALFLGQNLIDHQRGGYWPRAWRASTGEIIIQVENNGTIWMGDQPWPLIGLQCFYKKTGDERVKPAISSSLQFIKSLIKDDGKLFTLNVDSNQEVEETSCEAYAAVLQSLYESNESQLAEKLWDYLFDMGWESDLNYWKEAKNSYRPVLFSNTWLSPFLVKKGFIQKALDSLSLIGMVLFTCGTGTPCGLDGFGPIAVWYEGTLSYISAGGPHSIELLNNLKDYINPDGTISHYNDTSTVAGIWAVDWHSLDGTSWLYFAVSGISPFSTCDGVPYKP